MSLLRLSLGEWKFFETPKSPVPLIKVDPHHPSPKFNPEPFLEFLVVQVERVQCLLLSLSVSLLWN